LTITVSNLIPRLTRIKNSQLAISRDSDNRQICAGLGDSIGTNEISEAKALVVEPDLNPRYVIASVSSLIVELRCVYPWLSLRVRERRDRDDR
jgi:hypothetical protein